MELRFLGAARQVTGSMYMLTLNNGYKILVDCGMDYEMKKNPVEQVGIFPFEPVTVDLVLLTHAHIDHSGNLPALVHHGFKGHILCTPATAELTGYLLYDSANIQLNDYRKSLGRAKKSRRDQIPKPLFTEKNVKQTIEQFLTIPLHKEFKINDSLSIKFLEAGHLLGAASIEISVTENGKTTRIGFSGDLGRTNSKLVQNGEIFESVDYLVTESTYGGRKHKVTESAEDELNRYIQKTCIEFRGRLVIPAFSVGRTQAIVFTINQLKKKGLIPDWLKVFVDSPLAIKSTPVYERHAYLLNEEAQGFMQEHGSLFHFPGIEYLEGMDEHDELMSYFDPCVIISAAGMVEGGRIQEHVMNNIENPYSTILIAGFCAEGTLGYRLLLGQPTIKIKNKDKMVYAQIAKTDVYSSHPDHDEILNYVRSTSLNSKQKGQLKKVFLVHGETPQLDAMKAAIENENLAEAVIPDMGRFLFSNMGIGLGYLAACITLLSWTVGTLAFTHASREANPSSVNRVRLLYAFLVLTFLVMVFLGKSPIDLFTQTSTEQFFWFGLSGFVGLTLGDYFAFTAYSILGEGAPAFLVALPPGAALLAGSFLLNEYINWIGLIGMTISISGILLLILSRKEKENVKKEGSDHFFKGIVFAALGAIGQGVGLVLAKKGFDASEAGFNPLYATWIRMFAASIFVYLIGAFKINLWTEFKQITLSGKKIRPILIGTLFGPVIGVSFSLLAASRLHASVAQTIFSLLPATVLLASVLIYNERVHIKSYLAVLVSILGVIILVWRDQF